MRSNILGPALLNEERSNIESLHDADKCSTRNIYKYYHQEIRRKLEDDDREATAYNQYSE